jgi:hypothetical protein
MNTHVRQTQTRKNVILNMGVLPLWEKQDI